MKKISTLIILTLLLMPSVLLAKSKKELAAEETASLVEVAQTPAIAEKTAEENVVVKPKIRAKVQATETTSDIKSSDELLNSLKGSISTEAVKAPGLTQELATTGNENSREALFFKGELEEKTQTASDKPKVEEKSLPWVKTFLSFFAVSSLIMLLAYFAKGKKGVKNTFRSIMGNQQDGLRIVQNLSVGLKRQLLVVNFNGNELLIGMTPTSMTPLFNAATQVAIAPAHAVTEVSPRVEKIELQTELPTAYIPKQIYSENLVEPDNISLSDKIREAVKKLKPLASAPTKLTNTTVNTGERNFGAFVDQSI